MTIAENNEVKRNRIWNMTIAVSSVLIVVIAIFLLTKFFTVNPIEGTWESEDGNLLLEVSSGGRIIVNMSEPAEMEGVDIAMSYTINRDRKTVTVRGSQEKLEDAAEQSEGKVTATDLANALEDLMTTFDYSVENGELTLTEREYGESFTFIKK